MVRRILQTVMSFRNATGVRAALILVLTVAAYLPALGGGLTWDDSTLIIENPMVRASDGLHRFWFTTEAPDYYPLTWSAWWLEWRLWGASPLGYHAVNILLHAANAVLVWLVLRRLKIPGAWLAGLVFALHPVNVAAVAWISEQKSMLSMFFYLLAILLYVRFDEEERWRWYGLSLGAFLLALFSKTSVVMLPVVLLGCAWWRHGRVRRKDLLCGLPFLAFSLGLGMTTVWFQYKALGESVQKNVFASRLAAAGWAPWFYLFKALLPLNLMVIYPKWHIDASQWASYAPGLLLLGVLGVFWWARKTWGRPWLFGLGYFVVTLFPVLGFFDQGFYRLSLVADHWQYCSIIGVIALAAAAAERTLGRLGEQSRLWGTVVIVLLLGAATWERSYVYADAERLWGDNVVKNQGAWMAHYNLGVALQHAGRMPEAMDQWEQTLQIEPDYVQAHYNLGLACAQAGRMPAAMAHWEQALRIKPDFAAAHYNLSIGLERSGKLENAIDHLRKALDLANHQGNTGLANVVRARIQLDEGKLPPREKP